MAGSIGGAVSRIKSELDQWIDQQTVDEACREAGHRWRRRVLDPLATVHLLLLQLLAQVALSGLRHLQWHLQSGVSASAQAVCKARQRLPLSVMLRLVEVSCDKALHTPAEASADASAPLWHGLRVFLADAMSVLAPDTPQVRSRYGKASNQHGTSCSYPMPKLLALFDLGTGLIRKVIALPHARGERTCLSRLLGHLGKGDLLLADRGLSSYAHVALAMGRGVACCVGLPRWLSVIGGGKACHRLVRKLGDGDLLVRWTRPPARPTWMSSKAWAALPAELILRQVNLRVRRPGFRGQWLRVITTLTDAAAYPAEEIAGLYRRRWQVEVYFRDLKCTLKMKQLRSRSVAGVRKELAAFVLLYNLVRRVMWRAAETQRVGADRISFTDATRWLLYSRPDSPLPPLIVNRKRKRPAEPRVLKHARKRYPQMNQPRAVLRDRLKRTGRLAA